jgi:hypothetical protein
VLRDAFWRHAKTRVVFLPRGDKFEIALFAQNGWTCRRIGIRITLAIAARQGSSAGTNRDALYKVSAVHPFPPAALTWLLFKVKFKSFWWSYCRASLAAEWLNI